MSRLARNVIPERYVLDVAVDPRGRRFRGEVEIGLRVTSGLRSLELHAVDLTFSHVELHDADGDVPVVRHTLDARRETLRLELARSLAGPRARLRLHYSGPLRRDLRGLYAARSGNRRYAVTQLEAADARRFLPCFDEPDFKARFRLRVTAPVRNQVISNAPIARQRRRDGRQIVEFAETAPLSTYLLALVVGPLEGSRPRRCGPTPIRVWHVPGKRGLAGFALEAAAASLQRLERYFGIPYPYAKLDLIAVPDFEFGAMENAGAVTFRESLLLVDPKTVTLAEKKRVAEVIAHELAHMWFGDLVTMAWWDDLWLNEAFATWMAFRIIDEWKPEWKMWLDFEQHRRAAYALDALRNTHPIYTPVRTPDEATENFDAITYEKGASVVRMLERWLGAAAFRRGVRRYIRAHREGNARAADLWEALERASGQAVAPIVRTWIERPGHPQLEVRLLDRGGRCTLRADQERFFSSPDVPAADRLERWPVPIVARLRPTHGRTRLVRGLLRARSDELTLGPGGTVSWVYANAEEAGFYRPLHSPALLRDLARELRRLQPIERMGLLGHQWAGIRAGRAELESFLTLVEALGDEPEPEVLEAVHPPLAWVAEQVLPALGERASAEFRSWLCACFAPAFEELGWRARRGEDDRERLRRPALLRILGEVGQQEQSLVEARRRVLPYLRRPSALDPNLAGPVVELAAAHGDRRLYEPLLRLLRRPRTPQERVRMLMGLAGFRRPSLVSRTLRLSLARELPTQDVVPLLARLLANPEAREATWRFIRERWKRLSPRISPGLAPRLISALPALQTRQHRREVASFFRLHPLPTASRALRQALERFDLDADLRRRLTPVLRRWLSERRSGRAWASGRHRV
ncbi:MAG: M1 family aminopeptidase [Myxococcota bacterium]